MRIRQHMDLRKKKTSRSGRIVKPLLFGILIASLFSSCIPNSRIVYLQNKEGITRLENDSLISLTRIEYRLQPNDILQINFYSRDLENVEQFYPIFVRNSFANAALTGGNNRSARESAFLTGYNIDKDGDVEINALGRIKAAGLTTNELEQEIEKEIREKKGVLDILVGVRLNGIPYTMFGEVSSQGPNIIQQYEANVLEAIANSGDLTINADRSHVLLMRQYPDGIRIHEIDVTGRKFIETEFFFLQPDDLIYVPPLKIREIGNGDTALSNLATIVSVISSVTLIINVLGNN